MSTETDPDTNSEVNPEGAAGGAEAGKEQGPQGQDAPKTPETVSREAYQALQSKADKATADARRAREEAEKAVAEAVRAKREAEVAALKPEDRAALQKSWDLEDRERRLKAAEQDAEETARELAIAKLTLDNGLDAEARKELEGIDDVNEMRARAAELKVERLQKELEAAKSGASASKGEEQKAAPKGMRGDPAGSGSGSSQGTYDPAKFKGTGDLAGALRAQRAAGEVKYEKIPVRQ